MSKWSKVECNIQDREDLEKALQDVCGELGLDYQTGENLTLFGYTSRRTGAHFCIRKHAIRSKVAYTYGDLGYVWNEERGAYDLHLDDDHGRLTEFTNKIAQRYTYHHTIKKLAAQGLEPIEERLPDGSIRLEFRKTRKALAQAKKKTGRRVFARVGR